MNKTRFLSNEFEYEDQNNSNLKPPTSFLPPLQNPPGVIKLVMEAVCVMLNIKPDRKPDGSGKMFDDYWSASQKLLGDMKFLDKLKQYDKDTIIPATIKKIREK